MKPLSSAQKVLLEHPALATVGLEGTPFGLESCLSAEEVYLLDKRTSFKIESFVSLR